MTCRPRCFTCRAEGLELAHINVHGYEWAICKACVDRYEFFPPAVHRRLQGAFARRAVAA
jgi:hypothetical protein